MSQAPATEHTEVPILGLALAGLACWLLVQALPGLPGPNDIVFGYGGGAGEGVGLLPFVLGAAAVGLLLATAVAKATSPVGRLVVGLCGAWFAAAAFLTWKHPGELASGSLWGGVAAAALGALFAHGVEVEVPEAGSSVEDAPEPALAGGPPASLASTEGYACSHCGAAIGGDAEISPRGDLRCPFCDSWVSLPREA